MANQPGVNLYAVIGAKQVQIELLQQQLEIVSEGFQQLQVEVAELKAKYETPPDTQTPEEELTNSNGNKENAADILANADKPL